MLPDPYNHIPAAHRVARSFAAGEVVFGQGAPTRGLFVVLRGRVHLERAGPGGERFILHRATAGTSFAEASIFSERYHCDAVVVEAGELVRVDRAAVLAAFDDPDFARAYGRRAAGQIQAQRQTLEIIGIRSAEDRVLAGLVAGMLDGTITEFASKLQLSHEAAYRALARLVDAGRVQRPSRGTYRLADLS